MCAVVEHCRSVIRAVTSHAPVESDLSDGRVGPINISCDPAGLASCRLDRVLGDGADGRRGEADLGVVQEVVPAVDHEGFEAGRDAAAADADRAD